MVSTAPLSDTHHLRVASGPETEMLGIGIMALSTRRQQSLQFPGYVLGKDLGTQHLHRAFVASLGNKHGQGQSRV